MRNMGLFILDKQINARLYASQRFKKGAKSNREI